ncbi:hypothetical protein TOPH_07335 [Tolypocladium ophioglossoides CBS 100239]|uniref:Uncharacterized protein n=1 Tax=Tolypocladium ophioglossoides (strain CBS 100239) TaxID=1163406 RepID=A0A0L0N217_TOLOC|nr:hypothetical protein TOPH_07335 [Tolypocladium ophioglossoides CBS 100239]
MATIVDILADMGSIDARMEAITARLQNPKLRPSGQEVTQLHELVARILQHTQSLREKLTAFALGWTPEIFQKSDEHMSRAQSAIRAAAQGQVKRSIFRRNLVAIFQGHSALAVDSPRLRARKARKAKKGQKIRRLGADELIFNGFATQMVKAGAGGEPAAEIALNVRDTICDLGKEEPFRNVASYGLFVQEVEELARSPPTSIGPKSPRLDPHRGESHLPTSQNVVGRNWPVLRGRVSRGSAAVK